VGRLTFGRSSLLSNDFADLFQACALPNRLLRGCPSDWIGALAAVVEGDASQI
jgi:hypothetical protein